jgi:predicted dehydrogenase
MTFTMLASDDRTTAIAADPAAPRAVDAALVHAVVGVGRFGCVHARKLLALGGFELRALVDCASSARATSDDAHAPIALALMRRGCHVLVEKPLCTDRNDGALMIRTARQCGVTLSTGHIERFNPVFDAATVARLRNAAVHHRESHRPFMRFRRYSARVATARDSVLDLMVHDLDLFAWLCAMPAEAPLEVLDRHIGEQRAHARVRLGTLVADFESGYDSLPASAQLQVGDGRHAQVLNLRCNARATTAGTDDALARQYQGFRRAILGQPSHVASGADGLAAVTRACQILRA